jgi:hypothetical protein
MPTADECKKIISKLGFKLEVSPNLIATRLLSDDDKGDMMEGNLEISSLEAAVEVWRDNGMPNYASGRTETYEEEKNKALRQKMFARGQE